MSLPLAMVDNAAKLPPDVWRNLLSRTLAKSGEGLLLCDEELGLVFGTPRGHELARKLAASGTVLDGALAESVRRQLAAGDEPKTERVAAESGRGAVYVSAIALGGNHGRHVAIWLREEVLRDDRLFERMASRFGVNHRGFQLAQLVARGLSNREIGDQLKLSEATVKTYLHQLYRDCGVTSRTTLVALIEEIRR